jgi:hypothetical protein
MYQHGSVGIRARKGVQLAGLVLWQVMGKSLTFTASLADAIHIASFFDTGGNGITLPILGSFSLVPGEP